MAERALVTGDIDAAKRLVAFLDAHDFPVKAALWLYESDNERWRFVISFREQREEPILFYHDIGRLLYDQGRDLGLLPLDRVSFVDADRSIVRSIAAGYRGLPTEGRRLVNEMVGGAFVEEALILRLPA